MCSFILPCFAMQELQTTLRKTNDVSPNLDTVHLWAFEPFVAVVTVMTAMAWHFASFVRQAQRGHLPRVLCGRWNIYPWQLRWKLSSKVFIVVDNIRIYTDIRLRNMFIRLCTRNLESLDNLPLLWATTPSLTWLWQLYPLTTWLSSENARGHAGATMHSQAEEKFPALSLALPHD